MTTKIKPPKCHPPRILVLSRGEPGQPQRRPSADDGQRHPPDVGANQPPDDSRTQPSSHPHPQQPSSLTADIVQSREELSPQSRSVSKKMSKCCFNLLRLGGLRHSNPRLEPAEVAAGLRARPTRNWGALLLAVQPQAACLTPQCPRFLANETGTILTSVHLTELS